MVYVNFDGGEIAGPEDARSNGSFVCQGTVAPWGDDEALRAATMQTFRADWAAYDLTITDTRPASGNYDMIMAGDGRTACNTTGPVGGIAPMDCGNYQDNNVVFSFGTASGPNANGQATIMSQELAHAYGLEHVQNLGEIMNPSFDASVDQTFMDECFTVISQRCARHLGCEYGQQNSVAELTALIGTASPDTTPPSVAIVSPASGDTFDSGETFSVEVQASDDDRVTDVTLRVDGAEQAHDAEPPYAWAIAGIADGTHELQAKAVDDAGNEALSDIVTVKVGLAGGDEGSDGSDGEAAGEPDGSADGGESAGTETTRGADSAGEADEAAGGCACHHVDSPFTAGSPWLAVVALVRRRRAR